MEVVYYLKESTFIANLFVEHMVLNRLCILTKKKPRYIVPSRCGVIDLKMHC